MGRRPRLFKALPADELPAQDPRRRGFSLRASRAREPGDAAPCPAPSRGSARARRMRRGCLKRASRASNARCSASRSRRRPGRAHHHQHRHLAPARIGQADHRAPRPRRADRRPGSRSRPGGCFAAGDDQVLGSGRPPRTSRRRRARARSPVWNQPSAKPAAAGVAVVAAHQVRRLQQDLADLAVATGAPRCTATSTPGAGRPTLPTWASASSGRSTIDTGPVSVAP